MILSAGLGEDGRPEDGVAGHVYGRLRDDLLLGRLAPGERLRLDAIARRYGAGIGTIRELLSRLASEGLIVAEGQRGFQVAPVSAEDFREIAALRLLLESHALAQSFAAGDLDWEGRIVAAHHKLAVVETRMLDAGGGGDPALWKRYDRDFHHALISACGSRVLMAAYGAAYDKYLRYQMIAIVFRGEVAAREHATLLDCALSRDAEQATAVLRAHIDGCVEHALAGGELAWLPPLRPPARPPRGLKPTRPREIAQTLRPRRRGQTRSS